VRVAALRDHVQQDRPDHGIALEIGRDRRDAVVQRVDPGLI
jgi:hypothetical protein